jgi:hypothetical protein
MKRAAAFSSFGVTALVLALIVALGFRSSGAQGQPTNSAGAVGATSEAHFPFLGISKGETARVHVINLTTDLASPSLRFLVMFVDRRGVLIKPEEMCDVRAGETCTVALTASECVQQRGRERNGCDFRSLVVPEVLPNPPAGVDGGSVGGDQRWSSDLETVERREGKDGGVSTRLVLSPSLVLTMPAGAIVNPNPDGVIGNPDGVIGNPDGVIGNPDGVVR